MDFSFVFILLGIGVSFFLLYSRKKKWTSDQNRWFITGAFVLVSLAGYLLKGMNATLHGFQFLLIPFIYNCFDRLFKSISIRRIGRDFYLYLRYSDEIDDRMFADNPHINAYDKLFSFSLLVIILGLMICGVLLLRAYKLGHI